MTSEPGAPATEDDDARRRAVRGEYKSLPMGPALATYVIAHGTPPDDVQQAMIDETRRVAGRRSAMQVSAEQGAFLTFLTRLVGARHVVEVGTFTGYSALCFARGLAPGGRVHCFDIEERWVAVGRPFWERAGVADRIDVTIGPAAETLRDLPADPPVDLAFIDADKTGYATYYEELLSRLRPGGLILVDNVLWSGQVVDPSKDDPDTQAIRAFNDFVAADERVDRVMLALADGLTLARKR
jgi:caffeoyl-CoA O-methyltransferase